MTGVQTCALPICQDSENDLIKEGNYGAGCGASVGKLLGFEHAMKSGAGYAEIILPDGLAVGTYMAVNACGEIYDQDKILAGALADDDRTIISSHRLMLEGYERNMGGNTSIGCIITNADLTKTECRMVSTMAHDGLARSIRPVHTSMDGDTLFTMASGEVKTTIDTVGYLAEEAVRLAVLDAAASAEGMGGRPAYRDIIK